LPVFSRIMVLCTGNICRSPMAEALLRQRLPSRYRIESAGLGALVGHPADPVACELMAEQGLDISAHRARQVDVTMLRGVDLILVMDQGHRTWMGHDYPQLFGRVHKLLKWSGGGDVADPYRQPRAAFEQALQAIDTGVNGWLTRLG